MHGKVKRKRGLITTLRVRTLSAHSTRARLEGGGLSVPCILGRSGVTWLKREGDGATPAGALKLLKVLHRPDRLDRPPAPKLPHATVAPADGWCDDPGHPRYNRPVRLPFAASHEALWRTDGVYDVIGILDWNARPARRNRGSAIFFHLTRPDRAPTAGCIAVSRRDMLRLLPRLAPGCRILVG